MTGYVKLFRRLLESEVWKDSNANEKVILVVLLLRVNYGNSKYTYKDLTYDIGPGQLIIKSREIVKDCKIKGLNKFHVLRALKKFQRYEFLTYKSIGIAGFITITKFKKWQQNGGKDDVTPYVTPSDSAKEEVPKDTKEVKKTDVTLDATLLNKKRKKEKTLMPAKKNSQAKEKIEKYQSNHPKLIKDVSDDFKKVEANRRIWFVREVWKVFNKINPNNKVVLKAQTGKWLYDLHLILDTDKRDFKELVKLLNFVKQDKFWRVTTMSMDGLREHYDKICNKMIGKEEETKQDVVDHEKVKYD